MANGLTTLPRE